MTRGITHLILRGLGRGQNVLKQEIKVWKYGQATGKAYQEVH